MNSKVINNTKNIITSLSCYSSVDYFINIEDKISSVIRSLIKNHHFVDGNKRTALAVLYILCVFNKVEISSAIDLKYFFLDIAQHNYEVEYISKLLFV
ncbi:MAG: type II toxin-antitoxin system death-on-curing family toxin [Deltaproteobacteria bacterium]|nr:type II toxin-antitoxin system death-on-curing family toxin [Deltaproteobacteria bacterium]